MHGCNVHVSTVTSKFYAISGSGALYFDGLVTLLDCQLCLDPHCLLHLWIDIGIPRLYQAAIV